ncbi:MAG: putative addiction module antidote protein [Candidatus Poribacteria bacterium]|nr:putative addiction module antidote protein [Candidatus Poribacteria bacterium]
MRKQRKFIDYHIEQLRDPEDAKIYLSVALEEYEENGDIEAFLLAVRDVAEAQGGMSKLAERISLTREGIYKALSEQGNPQLDTMGEILYGLGFKFSIEAREDQLQVGGKMQGAGV